MQKAFFPLVLIIVLSVSSCTFIRTENPCQKYIEQQVMIELLSEVLLLETHISHQQTQSNLRDSIADLYAGLLQKYEVTPEEFENAFECYLLNRDLMNKTLDEVLSNLSIARSRADERQAEKSDDEVQDDEVQIIEEQPEDPDIIRRY